jgi:hypothetical protein
MALNFKPSILNHYPKKRILVIRWGNKCFFNGAGIYPTQEVEVATGFVICSAAAGTAKGLLAYYGTGGFVIYIKVTGCILQCFGGFNGCIPVLAKNGTGKAYSLVVSTNFSMLLQSASSYT